MSWRFERFVSPALCTTSSGHSGAGFGRATFSGVARFDGATFFEEAWFRDARFARHESRESLGQVNFVFATDEPFEGAVFGPEQPDDDPQEDLSSPLDRRSSKNEGL